MPLLKDPTARRDRPAITTWGRGSHSVRTERWRYIRYANGSEELYDHKDDPDEYTNLVVSRPSHAKTIIPGLKKWLPGRSAK